MHRYSRNNATLSPRGTTSLSASPWHACGALPVFLLLSAAFGIIGYQYYKHQIEASRQAAENELSAIADLKVRQIVEWRKERLGFAQVVQREPFFRQAAQKFLADPNDGELRDSLAAWLDSVREHNQSLRAVLLDAELNVRLASPAEKTYLGPIAAQYSREALQSNRIAATDLHRGRFGGEINFDLAIPLDSPTAISSEVVKKSGRAPRNTRYSSDYQPIGSEPVPFIHNLSAGDAKQNGSPKRPFGVLLLEIDPCKFLYPLIQQWPTPSRTAETLLVERQGDEALFLNELRHRKNTALIFRVPLARYRNVPAAAAAAGREGVIEGPDYRGVPALAFAKRIPGTPWHIVAKADQEEIFAPLRERAWTTAIILSAFYLGAALGVCFLWRRRGKRWRRDQLAAERRLQLFAENLNDVIWTLNFAGEFTYVSPSVEQLLGYAPEEFLRFSFAQFMTPASVESASAALKESLARAERGEIIGARNIELECYRMDGALAWLDVNFNGMYDEAGKLICFQGISRDITERKQADAALLRAKEEWENTFDVVPDAITILDTEHRIVRANKALAESVGATPGECAGQHCYRLMHGTEAPPEGCPHRQLLGDGKHHAGELRDERTGKYFWISVSPRRDTAGALLGCVHVARDITAQKMIELELTRHRDHLEELVAARTAEAEQSRHLAEESNEQLKTALEQANFLAREAKQASHAKSRFLAAMSHELRTPLNGMIGMIDLLRGTALEERQRRFAETARESAVALMRLINDILDFSKIEAGRLELERSAFALPQVVKEAAESIAPEAHEKRLELVHFTAPECRRVLLGDGNRLRQVLVNLLGNAVKFTARGEVCLRIARTEEGPGWIAARFEVSDTGIGIPADRRDRLFHSFSQVDSSTTRKYGGTGLGLAISKGIVEAMGGQIGVQSAEGVGSTFWFALKLDTSADAPQAAESLPAEIRNLRTMVAVGNESLEAAVSDYLREWGLRPEAVPAAAAAARLGEEADSDPWRLAVIDADLADDRGGKLAWTIRQNPAPAEPPLIVLTPYGGHDEGGARPPPANGIYLAKPFSQSALFDALVELCANSRRPPGQSRGAPSRDPRGLRSRHAGKARILLAEDNRINQMYCLEVLRQAGLDCDSVENGGEAVEAALSNRYDLILMDCHMPEMDGYEASWRIRRRQQADSARGRIPIVALTANALKGDHEVCLESGMDDYLSKPFEGRKLIETIDRLLDKSTATDAAKPADAAPPTAAPQAPVKGPGGDLPPLDFDVLLDRCMGDAGFAAALLEELESGGPSRLEEITRQIRAGAAVDAGKAAHSLKGAAGIVGAEPLRAVAAEIETAGKAGDIELAAALLQEMRAEMRRCLEYLPEIRERLSTMN
ncbi:MAG: PAS domain S-box protein [Pirellulales bacterium]|nr:PAS domain S-box protein [Pirellulales bacterium]